LTSPSKIINKEEDLRAAIFSSLRASVKESIKTNLMGYLNLPMFHDGKLKGRIVEETDGVIKDDHMGEFGHKAQAEYFYKHIVKNLK
jgi:hypothetical protein